MKTVISVKTDPATKAQAQAVAKTIGIPLSTLINAYLRELAASQSVTFSMQPRLKRAVAASLRRINDDIEAGRNLSPEFNNTEEMVAYLNRL